MKLYRVFFFNVTEIHYRVLPSFFYKFLNFDFSAEWSADRPWWMRRLPWGIAHDCLICIRSPVCKSGHPFCDWLAGGRRGARRNKKGRSQKPPPKKQKKSETRSRIDCFFHFLSPPKKNPISKIETIITAVRTQRRYPPIIERRDWRVEQTTKKPSFTEFYRVFFPQISFPGNAFRANYDSNWNIRSWEIIKAVLHWKPLA